MSEFDDSSGGSAEVARLREDARREKNWKRWGPYLSERQWGTVREDYSADGAAWDYFPHDMARSRAYRWGEDGLLGFCDRECRLCFSIALWNEKDPILKERLFGLNNSEGNHGEDVKEEYFYLDSTPTHSYLKALYKYPQAAYPYDQLVSENGRRSRKQPEFELADTGVFDQGRYFDVQAEYAKGSPNDLLIRITATNRGPETATLHLLPQLFYRNTWAWGCKHEGCEVKPRMQLLPSRKKNVQVVQCDHATLGRFFLYVDHYDDGHPGTPTAAEMLFTENETNVARVFGAVNYYPNVRDAFHEYIIRGKSEAVNHANVGTKVGAHFGFDIEPGRSVTLRLRLCAEQENPPDPFERGFDALFEDRIREANDFYDRRISRDLTPEQRNIARQAYAGLLWSKQFYHYIVKDWLEGDPDQPPPPPQRWHGRNHDWLNLFNRDVISMPDTWEYPWYAAWDLGFHVVCFAHVDPQFAKEQLILFLREWYMHPNGQLPAYEWALSDVNPPVHAWAAWRVYKMTGRRGHRDRLFLERVFQKQLLNFTWWVNRKDVNGKNIFSGGFLGLDNIGIFDRDKKLPNGTYLDQADGTAWMAFYCGTMLSIAIELAGEDPAYEDVASKFFEHFVAIVDAMNTLGGTGLWDEEDGFYYDRILAGDRSEMLKLRSMVGLIPLIAVEVLSDATIDKLPGFSKRMNWLLEHRKDLARFITYMEAGQRPGRRLLAVPSKEKLIRVLQRMLDEKEFLSPFGLRSMSAAYRDGHGVTCTVDGKQFEAHYVPGESQSTVFGGNSNWRGPVWFPLNYLIIEALEKYHHFYGDELKVEFPTGSGKWLNLQQIAQQLSKRLVSLFLINKKTGRRPYENENRPFATSPDWKDLLLFHEYFHGDTGRGLGASHQTGWTALVTRLLENLSRTTSEQDEHSLNMDQPTGAPAGARG